MTLELGGYDVSEAPDAQTALAALDTEPPDCVVLDLMMPGGDGFHVLRIRRERQLAPSTRFLVLSAKTGDRDYLRAFELDADDYLTKPVDAAQLVAKIEYLLGATADERAERRAAELEKSKLINRVNKAFDDL